MNSGPGGSGPSEATARPQGTPAVGHIADRLLQTVCVVWGLACALTALLMRFWACDMGVCHPVFVHL